MKYKQLTKKEILDAFNEVFSKPVEVKRKITMYTFNEQAIIQINQMMKEELLNNTYNKQ